MPEEKYFRRKRTIEGSEEDSVSVSPEEEISEESEEKKELPEEENLPAEIQPQALTIASTKEEIVERVRQTGNLEELKDLANLFGVSLTKKEIERASRESDLIDTLLEHAEDRIKNRGDYLSNDELLEFLKTFQTNVDKSKKNLNSDVDEASTKYANTHTEVNITVNNVGDELSRESREKVLEVVNMILTSERNKDVIIKDPEEVEVIDNEEENL